MDKFRLIKKCIYISFKTCFKDSIILILVSLIMSSIPTLLLLSYKYLINIIEDNFTITSKSIILLLIYCLILCGQKIIYNLYNHYYINYHSLLKFEKKIKLNFFDCCSRLSLEDYDNSEFVNEIKRAQNASVNIFRLFQIIVEIIFSFVGILLMAGTFFYLNSKLILFFLISTIPPIFENIIEITQKKQLLYKNTQSTKEEETFSEFLTNSNYLKEILIFKNSSFIITKWKEAAKKIVDEEKKANRLILLFSIILKVFSLIGTICAYIYLIKLYTIHIIDLPIFSASISAFIGVGNLLNNVFSLFGNLTEFSIMVEPYFSYINKSNSKVKKQERSIEHEDIKLENVFYKYHNNDDYTLKGINLDIKFGSTIAIVGENGCGKSTLAKIVLGFLEPTSGRVLSNEKNIFLINLKNFLENKASLTQSYNIYNNITLKENITFENGLKNNKNIIDLMKKLNLSNKINYLCEKYGRQYGGIELSGGEKQKIALIRLFQKESDLIILDEPTSSIDALQENIIYDMIEKKSSKRTVIIISHRLNLTKLSDKIVMMKEGKIIEEGTHDELLSKNGEYSQLWLSQSNHYIN